eukprot:2547304-Alexandrium_andersonii.AAC.1
MATREQHMQQQLLCNNSSCATNALVQQKRSCAPHVQQKLLGNTSSCATTYAKRKPLCSFEPA